MPGIIETLGNLSKLVTQRFHDETQKYISDAIGNGIAEGLQRSSGKLFTIAISVALLATGFFLTLWGISSAIDMYFAMRGLGYVLIGMLAVVTGALVYKK